MRLRALTERRRVGVRELARQAGVSADTASRWLRGASEPRASEMVLIADLLGVTLDQLVGRQVKVEDLTDAQKAAVKLVAALGLDEVETLRRLSSAQAVPPAPSLRTSPPPDRPSRPVERPRGRARRKGSA